MPEPSNSLQLAIDLNNLALVLGHSGTLSIRADERIKSAMTRAIPLDKLLNMRLSTTAKSDLSLAAELAGQDVTSFVLDSALTRARQVLLENAVIRLSKEGFDHLREAIDSPAEPSEALRGLFRRVEDNESTAL